MSGSGRPLLAAPTTSSTPPKIDGVLDHDPGRTLSLGKRPKRTLIESACSACRRRKSKCNGARPTCSRCEALRTECTYEAEEGESRWSALRRQNKTLETERDELREILDFLQTRSEGEAIEIFHGIRSSDNQESLQSVLQIIRQRRSSTHAYNAPSTIGGQTRLPPIRTMIEASEAAISHGGSGPPRRMSLASDGSGASYSSTHSAHSAHSARSTHTMSNVATSQPPSA